MTDKQPLRVENLRWKPKAGSFSLGPLSTEAPLGKFVAMIGPNGAGKSSLLKLVSGINKPDTGTLEVFGKTPGQWPPRQRGRKIAYLSQEPERPFGFLVRDYVGLGRFPHIGPFRPPGEADQVIVRRELEAWGLTELSERAVNTLSGGEFQRARLARALAQDPGLLLLDEPGNHLDLSSRIRILKRLRTEAGKGRSILAVLHDVNDALLYADEAWLMNAGTIVMAGKPKDVLDPDRLQSIYGLQLRTFRDSSGLAMLGAP